jgi:hypothetical protein
MIIVKQIPDQSARILGIIFIDPSNKRVIKIVHLPMFKCCCIQHDIYSEQFGDADPTFGMLRETLEEEVHFR